MPLLLIHGAPGDARLWTPVIDALPAAGDARAITLSYFGTARWPDDGGNFGTVRHKHDIVGYVEAAMETPVDLVAWSFGCHPALLAAIERPDLFRSLVLYEPSLDSYVDDPAAKAAFAEDCMAAFPPVMAAMSEGDDQRALEIIVDNAGGPGCLAGMSEERRRFYLDSVRTLSLITGGGQPPTQITSAQAAGLQVPVTIACGADTRPMFSIPSRGLADAIPHARFALVPGAGHMLPETDPVRFAALLHQWLEDMA